MFRLTFSDEAKFQVIILTMDRNKGDNFLEGSSTIYAVIWVVKNKDLVFPIYLESTLAKLLQEN